MTCHLCKMQHYLVLPNCFGIYQPHQTGEPMPGLLAYPLSLCNQLVLVELLTIKNHTNKINFLLMSSNNPSKKCVHATQISRQPVNECTVLYLDGNYTQQ